MFFVEGAHKAELLWERHSPGRLKFGRSTILIATSVIPTAAMPFKVNATGTKDTSGQRYVTFVHLTDMFIAFPSINETPASKVSSTRWVPGQILDSRTVSACTSEMAEAWDRSSLFTSFS